MAKIKDIVLRVMIAGGLYLVIQAITVTNYARDPVLEMKWENNEINIPWPKDGKCRNFVTKFVRKGSLAPMALVSYMGSGNTWLRYLIEGAGGIFTGSVYYNDNHSSVLYKDGFLGEVRHFDDGSTLLQKTHSLSANHKSSYNTEARIQEINKFQGRAVLLIRNPFDAVVSWFNLKRSKSKTAKVEMSAFLTPDFKNFANNAIIRWYDLIEDWLTYGTEVHVVFYEDLKETPIQLVSELLTTLGIQINQNRIKCLEKNNTGSFKRMEHNEESPYTDELATKFREIIEKAADLVEKKTGLILPTHKYHLFQD